jgi:FAD/FMN-containing dehydrogenase
VLRQAALVVAVAAALTPVAAAGGHGHTPQAPPNQVVVRTELVPADDGFDWIDAAAGFGLAIALVAVVLLVAGPRLARN